MTGIHDSVETYEPKVEVKYEGNIPKIDNSFDDITDDNGNINIVINSEVIGQTLAKKIYTSWTSGLRELYNNEARACRTSKKMGGNPSIVVTVDPNKESREVKIQGVDSLGITKAMFNKVLRVIGTSGNVDGEEIGQYGMGFISYALMCDAMIMETWARETDEHYAMLCDSGLKFKPIPLDTTNEVNNMTEYGTKLTMTCNDDVSFSTLITNIYKLARFSQIPTKIILKESIEGYSVHSWRDDDDDEESYDAGVYECPLYKNGMEYIKDEPAYEWIKNSKQSTGRSIATYKEVTIDNEDYRFDGIFVLTKSSYGAIDLVSNRNRKNNQMFLVGTEIDSDLRLSCFHSCTINIKNERKYSPVASRDSLDTKALDLLTDDLNEKLKEYFRNEFPISTIDDYNKSLDKAVLSRNVTWTMEKYFTKEMNAIGDTLNTRYGTPDKSYSQLSDMLATGGTLICLKSLRQNLMDLLSDHIDGTVTFFRMPTRLSDEERGHRVALFKDLNIIMGEDYKKENKLKESGNSTIIVKNGKKSSYSSNRTCVLYNSTRGTTSTALYGTSEGWRSGSHKYSTTIGDINANYHSNIISVDTKRFPDVIDTVNVIRNDWKVVHDMKGLSDKIMTVDKLVNKFNKKEFQTNKGIVKGSDLNGYYMAIVMKDKLNLDRIPYVKSDKIQNYLWGSSNKDQTVTWLAIKDIEEYVALQIYIQYKTNNKNVTIWNDQFGDTFKSVLSNPVTGNELEFNNEHCGYQQNKTDYVARMYWINESLPNEYADVFINAILHNVNDIDRIELQAYKLKVLLSE